ARGPMIGPPHDARKQTGLLQQLEPRVARAVERAADARSPLVDRAPPVPEIDTPRAVVAHQHGDAGAGAREAVGARARLVLVERHLEEAAAGHAAVDAAGRGRGLDAREGATVGHGASHTKPTFWEKRTLGVRFYRKVVVSVVLSVADGLLSRMKRR